MSGEEAKRRTGRLQQLARSASRRAFRDVFEAFVEILRISPMLTIVLIVVGGMLFLLPRPETIMAIEAGTETLVFEVSNPQASTIGALEGMVAPVAPGQDVFAEAEEPQCRVGRLEPPLGTRLRYRRTSDTRTEISVEGLGSEGLPARFFSESGTVTALGRGSLIVIESDPGRSSCPAQTPPLPIWGPGEIGDEGVIVGGSGQAGALISAEVKIYARALERVLGIRFDPGLYMAGEIVVLPGSRIVEDDPVEGRAPAAWVGSARIDSLRRDELSVAVTTSAPTLSLYRAGFEGADTLAVSALVQQFMDPGVVRLQFLLGVLLASASFFLGLLRTAEAAESGDGVQHEGPENGE